MLGERALPELCPSARVAGVVDLFQAQHHRVASSYAHDGLQLVDEAAVLKNHVFNKPKDLYVRPGGAGAFPNEENPGFLCLDPNPT